MIRSLRTVAILTALGLAAAACSGSDSSESETTDVVEEVVVDEAVETTEPRVEEEVAPVTDAPPATDAAPATEAPPATDAPPATEAPPATDAPPTTDAGAAASVSLVEWGIEAPTEYAAGEITFTATNNGGFPHEFVVIQGEGYESLPLAEGGAVIEDDLPTGALIGRTARMGGGSVEDLTVTLGPGNYVLLCNLGGGNTSHAGQGQRLDITVS